MITEALAWIGDLITKAQDPKVLRVDNVPNKAWLAHGGNLVPVETEQPPLRIFCNTLESLIAVAADVFGDHHIYVDTDSIHLVDQTDERRSMAILTLVPSTPLVTLLAIDHQPVSHKYFVTAFRTVFEPYAPAGFAAKFAQLDFRRKNDGTRTIDHGSESLGRSIEAKARGADELPDQVLLDIPLFATPGLRETRIIDCKILVDPTNEEKPLSLHVKPDAITTIRLGYLDEIAQRIIADLGGTNADVFLGHSGDPI